MNVLKDAIDAVKNDGQTGLVAVLTIVIGFAMQGAIFFSGWNIGPVPVFGAPAVDYWQAVGIVMAARMIFPRGSK